MEIRDVWLAQEGGPAKKAALPDQSGESYRRTVLRILSSQTEPCGDTG
jgi:hypothetical protein